MKPVAAIRTIDWIAEQEYPLRLGNYLCCFRGYLMSAREVPSGGFASHLVGTSSRKKIFVFLTGKACSADCACAVLACEVVWLLRIRGKYLWVLTEIAEQAGRTCFRSTADNEAWKSHSFS